MREIWKSNDTEDLLNLSFDEKIDELINMGYDAGTLENMSEDEIDRIISDDPSVVNEPLEDFEYNIVPKIAAHVKDGLIFDERFNLVDPSKLLDFNGYSATLDEDDNGELWFNVEGRKAFPILGFSPNQEDFINQLERLGILDTLHNLYPEKEDEDFDDPYYYADLIPMDWALLEEVLTRPAVDNYGVNEDMNKINEASTKNAKGLKKELEELKELSNEYGREYFTQMPFTSFDNDPMSIEYQYPEFFKIVKSFFKEMGVLEGDQLNDTDVLDMSWDEDISQHDWDTLMAVCDRLVNKGGTVQIEKIYKNNFDDHLGSDDEIIASREVEEESLNEGANEELAMHELKETVANFIYDKFLESFDDNIALHVHSAIPSYNIEWCNEEGGNFIAEGVDKMKRSLARKVTDALFENAPRELSVGESLTEGFEPNATLSVVTQDADNWGFDEEEFDTEVMSYDGYRCKAEQSVDVGTGDPKDDYYDLEFEDGHELYGVSGYELDFDIDESLNEEIWHNRGAGDCEIIERSASGRNALVKRLADGAIQPYVIALNMGEDSWGQGKYYTELEDAKRD